MKGEAKRGVLPPLGLEEVLWDPASPPRFSTGSLTDLALFPPKSTSAQEPLCVAKGTFELIRSLTSSNAPPPANLSCLPLCGRKGSPARCPSRGRGPAPPPGPADRAAVVLATPSAGLPLGSRGLTLVGQLFPGQSRGVWGSCGEFHSSLSAPGGCQAARRVGASLGVKPFLS